jgi:hypothetical protein
MKRVQDQPAVEKFMEDIVKAMAAYSARTSSESIKRAMQHKAASGLHMSKPPLGYRPTETSGLYEPTVLGDCIGNLIETYLDESLTLDEVVQLLKQLVAGVEKKTLSRGRIVKLMLNPYYAGFVVWSGSKYEGLHKPIISKEQHSAVVLKIPFWEFPDKSGKRNAK